MELNTTEIRSFIREIVVKSYPEELESFDIFADDYIEEFQNKGHITYYNVKGSEFESGDSIHVILKFLSITVGTLKLILDIYKLKKEKAKEELKEQDISKNWKEQLVKAGLSDKEASIIVKNFRRDVRRIL